MPKLCPNITFPHQQDFFPIRSATKSSTARFSHENLVEKFKILVQDFVPIRTALRVDPSIQISFWMILPTLLPLFTGFCITEISSNFIFSMVVVVLFWSEIQKLVYLRL